MKLIVQKFGGTSVKTAESRQLAIGHINNALKKGYQSVVVVSAIGRSGDPYATDTLLGLVDSPHTALSLREQDMLVSVGELISANVFADMLNKAGIKAAALSGGQAGILTDANYQNADILAVNPKRIFHELNNGADVVVVAGFQGHAPNGDVTTLGRGGSDTSAAALGVAVKAEFIDIFTDVEGIMTADPRVVKKAIQLDKISYTEVMQMATEGAKVIHPRAVETANKGKVPMRVRSTYSQNEGTLITDISPVEQTTAQQDRALFCGVTHINNLCQFTITKPAQLDEHSLTAILKENRVNASFISTNETHLLFSVPDVKRELIEDVLVNNGNVVTIREKCAKITVVGIEHRHMKDVSQTILTALDNENIQILQTKSNANTLWVLVDEVNMIQAANSLHDIFNQTL
ncbi:MULTISPECIES: aspartate kinase [Brochothrix]|uniref:Aspartokinase n=1 Tax=Brochothrix thermosphacta TaxID=2756 RepID=A0A1D2LWU8_BROTH|nr:MULTISPECIES: aspartate kinase [Brochothrix]SLM97348.1 Aspartokinase [Brachybacterium faecium]ANZ94045.1 aspartate kinase [Brochothrix thermosphacta]ANZ97658.1 aspartate kinase [Brochothrix thermosphacta]ATF27107.1 aspartate kinase [Brochothrix thermosphacta]ATH86466.1 aspartate kinase [Brochothrix thermosphacta]